MLLLHAEHGIVLIYLFTHTHNMTQYCCMLFLHAEHGIVLIYLLTHTQYDTELLYVTFTCRAWHSIDLQY